MESSKLNQLLNEVYYGGNPLLIEIESYFKEMIDYSAKQGFTLENMPDVKNTKHFKFYTEKIKKVEKTFAKLFGLNQMYIEIIDGKDALASVATLSVQSTSLIYGKKLKVYKGKYAISFNPKAKVNVIIFLSLVDFTLLNEKELVAVLLHEMGHNLNRRHTLPAKIVNYMPSLMKFLITIAMSDDAIETYRKEREEASKDKSDESVFKKFASKIAKLTDFSILVIYYSITFLMGTIKQLDTYREEKFADGFAAMFGYSMYVHEALRKYDEYFFKNYGAGQRNKEYDRATTYAHMIKQLFDPHPENVARMRSTADYIKTELKINGSTYSKETVALLERDLSYLENIIEKDTHDGGAGNVRLREAMLKFTGGLLDIRELFIKNKWEKIDKQLKNYDEL